MDEGHALLAKALREWLVDVHPKFEKVVVLEERPALSDASHLTKNEHRQKPSILTDARYLEYDNVRCSSPIRVFEHGPPRALKDERKM